MQSSFVDKALARRLESAEEVPQVLYARLYSQTRPEIGAAVEEICGGHMIFAGLNSPIGRTVGAGLDRPFTTEDIARIEAFYKAHDAPPQVDVCPLHGNDMMEMFKTRGYSIAELNNVLWRRLHSEDEFPAAPQAVTIRPALPEEAERLAIVVGRSFHEGGDLPDGFTQMMTPLFQFEGALPFVAEVEGRVAGAGVGLIIAQHKVVALFGAGTLPEFRGRGIQTALLGARLRLAADAGCEIAVIVTIGGSISQRNAERLGFRVAYSKATLIKDV